MFEMVEGFGEEVSTILCSRDMRSVDGFSTYKVADKVPSNIDVL